MSEDKSKPEQDATGTGIAQAQGKGAKAKVQTIIEAAKRPGFYFQSKSGWSIAIVLCSVLFVISVFFDRSSGPITVTPTTQIAAISSPTLSMSSTNTPAAISIMTPSNTPDGMSTPNPSPTNTQPASTNTPTTQPAPPTPTLTPIIAAAPSAASPTSTPLVVVALPVTPSLLDFRRDFDIEGRSTFATLGPFEEHWYTFFEEDPETVVVLMFTPNINFLGENFVGYKMEFFIHDENQIPDWPPAHADSLPHIGAGAYPGIDRDGDLGTGELIWRGGALVPGTRYYLRLVNRSSETIEYCLAPGDVYQWTCG